MNQLLQMATNVDRDFIETIAVELVNKSMIFTKLTEQGLDSYFAVNAKKSRK